MIEIETLEELKSRTFDENEIIFIKETNEYKQYSEGEWVDYNPELTLSLYDLNKSMFTNAANLDWRKVENVFKKYNSTSNFLLLYGKEISYFTLFRKNKNTNEKFHEVFKDCLINIGDLKACDVTEDGGAIEIWIKRKDNGDMTCLYLFNYDEGVVDFNG